VAQKFHFAILRIEVTRASRGLSAIVELLVLAGSRSMIGKLLQNRIAKILQKYYNIFHVQ